MSLMVQRLSVDLPSPEGRVRALDGVDLVLTPGETLALVGESGAGKSVLIETILRLLPQGSRVWGRILYRGLDLLRLPPRDFRNLLGKGLAWVPQNAATAFHPTLPLGTQLTEGLLVRGVPRDVALARARALLEALDLEDETLRLYPHQLSGGMLQRALLATALALEPEVLLVDEPSKGLDPSRKAQLAALLARAQALKPRLALLLVSHDLELVRRVAQRVVVLHGGQVVEEASTEILFRSPLHPFTQALLEALPENGLRALPWVESRRAGGCRFYPRCPQAEGRCREEEPPLFPAGTAKVRCWRHGPGSR